MNKKTFNFIDLFAGAGGLSKGFEDAGFSSLLAIESDRYSALTYQRNHPKAKVVVEDIKKLNQKELKSFAKLDNADLIIGGLPCQGFSMAGNLWRGRLNDDRNNLYKEFKKFVKFLKPKFFVIENVANLAKHKNGKTLKKIINGFQGLGYKVDYKVLNSAEYGVPQLRKRIFIIGNNLGVKNPFPKKTKRKEEFSTIASAISDLPPLKSGETCTRIPNHESMNHSKQMLKKMKYVRDGGDRNHIPKRLRPKSGDLRKYVRFNSKKPSFCITGDMRKVFHPSQNRALTVRELARIQTFADDYEFLGNKISQQLQVGNAVPPLLAFVVGKEIFKELNEHIDEYAP
jgi:DNA (cytosine-5)-methyltransferase 1